MLKAIVSKASEGKSHPNWVTGKASEGKAHPNWETLATNWELQRSQ